MNDVLLLGNVTGFCKIVVDPCNPLEAVFIHIMSFIKLCYCEA